MEGAKLKKFLFTRFITMIILSFAVLMIGCGGGKKAPIVTTTPGTPEKTPVGELVQVPEWFSNLPSDPNYIYATATGTSTRDLQMAIDRAKVDAERELASQISTKVMGMLKSFREEVGMDEDAEYLTSATSVSKSVTSELLRGRRPAKQPVYKEAIGYRAYVLMELPIGQLNSALMQKIKDNKNMYTRFRESQAFQELEGEVEKYERFKKEQEQGAGN